VDPTKAFCDNPDCPARGKVGEGNIKVHCHKTGRLRCWTCKKTFAATKGTPLFRLHKDRSLFFTVITLLTHGCPLQAIVVAFGLDERTVAAWYKKSGSHGQDVHHHFLETQPLDLQHVQADELYGKRQGGRSCMAMAMAVPCRLWLGGVCSPVRNLNLIQRLVNMVRVVWPRASCC
jgi:transposase-like protein